MSCHTARQTYSGEGSVTETPKPVKQVGFGSAFTPTQKSRPGTSNLRPNSRGSNPKASQTGETSTSYTGNDETNVMILKEDGTDESANLVQQSKESVSKSQQALLPLLDKVKARRRWEIFRWFNTRFWQITRVTLSVTELGESRNEYCVQYSLLEITNLYCFHPFRSDWNPRFPAHYMQARILARNAGY